ncbi:hypothetical protein LCGC14_0681370 [marine sediment metagenome]|uniref:Leucine-rich repeat domain-containing protein n=1 Tax=marine sediment metagenome TaxID=412755 RepID=A0A0F9QT13_9ZZZZ|nr:MAG: leucine-rich repeat domain protein [Candidatus Lokiarchaeum sp. GC14_75]
MSAFLTPEQIKTKFFDGKLNRDKAAELLISLIEGNDNTKVRVRSIQALEKMELQNKKIFKILENYLISDEDAILRATAAEYIIQNFLEESIAPLNWVIRHDKSPLILKVFFDYLYKFDDKKFELISLKLQTWETEFASKLGIVPEESRFFLDLEALFAKDKRNYEFGPESYRHYQNLADKKGGEPWVVINNKHVVSLNFNYYKWNYVKENPTLIHSLLKLVDLDFYICSLRKYSYDNLTPSIIPESIGSLIYLERLNLRRNGLAEIPSSINKLTRLEELDLSYNHLEEIPQVIRTLSSLKKLNIKRNRLHIIPDSLLTHLYSLESFYL